MYDYLVGTARRSIHPEQPAPLCGYGNSHTRMHEVDHDHLSATAVCITDRSGNSVVMITADVVNTWKQYLDPIRDAIEEKTGIPKTNVYLSSTHTHSAPDQGCDKVEYIEKYNEMFVARCIEAALEAWEDRKEAEMYTAVTETDRLNCTRIYLQQDGNYVSPGLGKSPMVVHIGANDPEMRLICFKRQGGKDVLMMNWQAHGTLMSYRTKDTFRFCSADFIGATRAYLEEKLGCTFAYFQGAAANLMPTSDVPGELDAAYAEYEKFGRLLGDTAISALGGLKKMPAGPIRTKQTSFPCRCHHLFDHLLPEVDKIYEEMQKTDDKAAALEAGKKLGFTSLREMWATDWRSRRPEILDEELNYFAIGDVGFATAPNEVFSEFGIGVRGGSPYEMTFYMGYTNGRMGYLPTKSAFGFGCYETAITYYEPGTGEKVMVEQISQLRALKEETE